MPARKTAQTTKKTTSRTSTQSSAKRSASQKKTEAKKAARPKKVLKQLKRKAVSSKKAAKPKKQTFAIFYYSRTKNTMKIAHDVALHLDGQAKKIIDHTPRKGIINWLKAGRDALKKLDTKISTPDTDFSGYDGLVVGTPIWAGKIAPAVRTFLKQLPRTNGKKAGVFITHLSKDVPESALDELAVLVEKKGYRVVSRENFRMNQKSIVLRRKIQSFAAKLLVD